jgi:hypothetical protein
MYFVNFQEARGPKQLKEASVPKKCTVLIIINNTHIVGFYMDKD